MSHSPLSVERGYMTVPFRQSKLQIGLEFSFEICALLTKLLLKRSVIVGNKNVLCKLPQELLNDLRLSCPVYPLSDHFDNTGKKLLKTRY